MGASPLLGKGERAPHLTVTWAEAYSSIPSDILSHAAIWPQQTWAENLGCVPLGRGSWVPILHNVARAEAYLHAKFHLDPSNRLATVHERYRQTDNGLIAQGEPFYKRSPKNHGTISPPSAASAIRSSLYSPCSNRRSVPFLHFPNFFESSKGP